MSEEIVVDQGFSSVGHGVLKTFRTMKEQRVPIDKEWERAYRFSFPTLGQGFNWKQETMDTKQQMRVADVWQEQMFTNIGAKTNRLLASAILSSLTPPNVRWADLAITGVEDDELSQVSKEWLDDSATTTWEYINASNFDAESIEYALHICVAGIGALFIDWRNDLDVPGLFFESSPISNMYFAESLGRGTIDTSYKSWRRTIAQLANEFGIENLNPDMQKAYERDPYSELEHLITWTIRPRMKGKRLSKGKFAKNLPWESLVVDQSGHVIKESGFHEFPINAARWLKTPGTPYARGPFYSALPDVITLNTIIKKKLENADLITSQPVLAVDDGILNPATLKLKARMVIPVGDIEKSIKVLDLGGDIQLTDHLIEWYEEKIMQIMMADQLSPSEKTIQTAAEVTARANQVRQVLGPVFARLQKEFVAPMFERAFALCQRNGVLAPIPSEIKKHMQAGRSIRVGFTSPLARAQRLNELNAIDQTMTRFDNFAQADPGVLDLLDMDKIARRTADLNGMEPDLLIDQDKVDQLRNQRQKQQAAAADAQNAAVAQGQQTPQTQPGPALPAPAPGTAVGPQNPSL